MNESINFFILLKDYKVTASPPAASSIAAFADAVNFRALTLSFAFSSLFLKSLLAIFLAKRVSTNTENQLYPLLHRYLLIIVTNQD